LISPVVLEFNKSIVDFPSIKRLPGGASNAEWFEPGETHRVFTQSLISPRILNRRLNPWNRNPGIAALNLSFAFCHREVDNLSGTIDAGGRDGKS
jgi:hypothetical protein